MKKKQPKWKPIKMGERLPCQSFLRKKNGEILKLSTVAGVTVGQDAYYLPVDDVIEEIRNYPIEESEDEKMRKELFERFSHIKGFDWYGLPIKDILAWLGKQGEQKPADTEKGAKGNDREIPNSAWSEEDEKVLDNILYILNQLKDTTPHKEDETAKECIDKLKSLKDRFTWKPSDAQMVALKCAITTADEKWVCMNTKDLESLYEDLMKLREE